jgi:nucleoid DNA-binding protein
MGALALWGGKMTKRELVVMISRETGMIQEDVYAVIQKALDHITEALGRGDHIELREFGVFDVCVRKARVGRNPNQPERTVRIPERSVVRFRAGKRMKRVIATVGQAAG